MRRYRRLDVGCKKSTDRGPGEGADAGSRQHVWHKEGRTFENGAQNVRAKASDITPGRPPAGGGRVPDLDLATRSVVYDLELIREVNPPWWGVRLVFFTNKIGSIILS